MRRNDQESSMELRDEQNEEMAELVLCIPESDIVCHNWIAFIRRQMQQVKEKGWL